VLNKRIPSLLCTRSEVWGDIRKPGTAALSGLFGVRCDGPEEPEELATAETSPGLPGEASDTARTHHGRKRSRRGVRSTSGKCASACARAGQDTAPVKEKRIPVLSTEILRVVRHQGLEPQTR